MPDSDARLDYPATQRNREPILEVLRGLLEHGDRVLEIGSGSGQHAAYFATHLPTIHWQPSDVEDTTFASIRAWSEDRDNVASPCVIDVTKPVASWPIERGVDVVFCANVIHISPWDACLGLLAGAGELLETGGRLIFYGPFMREGRHTSPSNASFDEGLRARDPRWGVRDLDVVTREAARHRLTRTRVIDMPANNLTVVFQR